ncbi:MAG: cytochrome c maturation protein CcmE [Natronohydrobacter sp.]|nr:cytochrome c maturation protein CcmE [Legionellaceae bacterium]MCC5957613.1 cytochrome c maturation protein CcmE [Natronohydrobacter sp.]
MNAVRQRRLFRILFVALALSIVSALVLYALRQNINLFFSPSEIASQKAPYHRLIRLGGMVVPGSLERDAESLELVFKLTDYKHTVSVHYSGILPDLFREGQGIVTTGTLSEDGEFRASEVLAKHDENYMPPEVKSSLADNKIP